MATLKISEYKTTGRSEDGDYSVAAGQEPAEETNFPYSTSTVHTFGPETTLVRLQAPATAYIDFGEEGETPIATANSKYIVADGHEYFSVKPNSTLAVYDGTT